MNDAFATWSAANAIADQIEPFDIQKQRQLNNQRPWASDPLYFKRTRISALALLKILIHARSGNTIEVMGSLVGYITADCIVVNDVFILPVEGTETRVNAGAEAYEYMVEFSESNKKNLVGWYHSHPGYGCWLSGIDVNTQSLNQQFQDPWLAIVVDPMKTVSAGKVDIGAFRTYPKDYKPSTESTSNVSIPLAKAIDFGAHCNQYYQLEISYFKSELDASLLSSLWQKYWKNTLSSSNLYLNRKYHSNLIVDLSAKIEDVKKLGGCVKDSARLSVECNHGAIMQVLKHRLFNT